MYIIDTMKRIGNTLIGLTLLAFFSGCVSTPLREVGTAQEPLRRISAETAGRRAEELKKLLSPWKFRAVMLEPRAFDEMNYPASRLADMVKALGFNRLFCDISSESELDDRLARIVAAAAAEGIPTELRIRQGEFLERRRGNALIRFFYPECVTLPVMARKIVAFNRTLPDDAKLAGVTVLCEPHVFNGEFFSRQPADLLYCWTPETFGAGMDNDRMMAQALKLMRATAEALAPLPFTVEFPDFYNELNKEKKLSRGTPTDFAALSNPVIIRTFGNKPSELFSRIADELDALPQGIRAVAAVDLATHTSIDSGALRRRDWNDFIRATTFLQRRCRKTPIDGVLLGPLSEIEFMRNEQD